MGGGYSGAKSWFRSCSICGTRYQYSNQSRRLVDPKTLVVTTAVQRLHFDRRSRRLVERKEGLLATDVHELACLRRQRLHDA